MNSLTQIDVINRNGKLNLSSPRKALTAKVQKNNIRLKDVFKVTQRDL
jgi:hypothetical protein